MQSAIQGELPLDAAKELDGTDTGADEFFKRMVQDAEKPSEEPDEEEEEPSETDDTEEPEGGRSSATEDSDESPEDEEEPEDTEGEEDDTEEPEETEEATEKPKKVVEASEDAVVKIKIDGQEVTATVKDLKRLYGQEASLTRKSQEAAELKKRAEDVATRHVTGLEALLARAKEQAAPYANINFLALTKDPNVSSEELSALSDAANRAFDNVRYLETELDGVIKAAQDQRQQQMMQMAREAIKTLTDPKTGIPGWNEQMYNDIRSFAVSSGMDAQVVNEMVDPVAFKILHMAMQYQKGKTAVTKTKKIDKTPKRIIKGTPDEVVKSAKADPNRAMLKKLQQSGSVDDAADAFLAQWEN
jgi:hypothetical protein